MRFFFLFRKHDSHLDFDLDLAKRQAPENPVFYVQYAHARLASVFREAEKAGLVAEGDDAAADLVLLSEEELALAKKAVGITAIVAEATIGAGAASDSFLSAGIGRRFPSLLQQADKPYNRCRASRLEFGAAVPCARAEICDCRRVAIIGSNRPGANVKVTAYHPALTLASGGRVLPTGEREKKAIERLECGSK